MNQPRRYMVRHNHLFQKIQGKWSLIESYETNDEAWAAMEEKKRKEYRIA